MWLTLTTYVDRVQKGQWYAFKQFQDYLQSSAQDTTNSFLYHSDTYTEENLSSYTQKLLAWAALWIKDNFHIAGTTMSCASSILQWYKSPYSATVIKKLQDAGATFVWKLNMDEFAMWTTWESSSFGPTKNPYDHTRIPWWSSSWSAAAVANDLCIAALWTDTGWSIRLPASMCGVVWIKPTYGRISRYWIQAMASSFDHIGVFSKTVEDWMILTQIMSGQDKYDPTTQPESNNTQWRETSLQATTLQWMNFALPQQFFGEWLDEDYHTSIEELVKKIEDLWWKVDFIDFPDIDYAIAVYYILVAGEVSTNLSRFDGVRYWMQKETDKYETIFDYYAAVRSAWLWKEVKRRILTWAYVLSAWYHDAYYNKACAVRNMLIEKTNKIFSRYDAIIWPTATSPAWKLWSYNDDPVAMYMLDKYTVLANLVQAPAMSIPVWFLKRSGVDLPIWFQIMTKKRDEATMFRIGHVLETSCAFPLRSRLIE